MAEAAENNFIRNGAPIRSPLKPSCVSSNSNLEMSRTQSPSGTRSDQLLNVLSDFRRVLIVMHDNPDPDAIAAGWALHCLITECLGKPVRLVGGGSIVRAENKHMVALLSPPIELVSELTDTPDTGTILVDCNIGTSNHLVTRAGIRPVAVIDHHLNGNENVELAFSDIRAEVAASATITASYLHEQNIEPGLKLATATIYAIRTETTGCENVHTALDRSVVSWMTKISDPSLLAEIESAPLDREYFGDLALAMQSTVVFGDTALCFLPRAHGAEIVGEVADLLVRCRPIRCVLCAAVVGDDLLLSARTQRGYGNAARLIQKTLEGLGGGGGHEHRAGGKIPDVTRDSDFADRLRDELQKRWLHACGIEHCRGERLISRQEIAENL